MQALDRAVCFVSFWGLEIRVVVSAQSCLLFVTGPVPCLGGSRTTVN